MKTVKEVAELSGVTVRTLHHYDEIGLLQPSERSEAGYRLYSQRDLERLQEVLGWRALGFSLAEINDLIDDPHYERAAALRRQRSLVEEKWSELRSLRAALDVAIAAEESGTQQEVETMFDGFDPQEYEAEARERWGKTDEFGESARRTADYGEREWRSIREEGDRLAADFASLLAAGADPAGDEAQAVAARHREYISHWFYECTPQIHRGLAEIYVADPRFTKQWDRHAPGLARFVSDVIRTK